MKTWQAYTITLLGFCAFVWVILPIYEPVAIKASEISAVVAEPVVVPEPISTPEPSPEPVIVPVVVPEVIEDPDLVSVESVIRAVNGYRLENGVFKLKENRELDRLAQIRADDMATRGYFSHDEPGSTEHAFIGLLHREGFKYEYAGENLARDFDTLPAMMDGWINSPLHALNMRMNTRTDIGVGINGDIVVVLFAGN